MELAAWVCRGCRRIGRPATSAGPEFDHAFARAPIAGAGRGASQSAGSTRHAARFSEFDEGGAAAGTTSSVLVAANGGSARVKDRVATTTFSNLSRWERSVPVHVQT